MLVSVALRNVANLLKATCDYSMARRRRNTVSTLADSIASELDNGNAVMVANYYAKPAKRGGYTVTGPGLRRHRGSAGAAARDLILKGGEGSARAALRTRIPDERTGNPAPAVAAGARVAVGVGSRFISKKGAKKALAKAAPYLRDLACSSQGRTALISALEAGCEIGKRKKR